MSAIPMGMHRKEKYQGIMIHSLKEIYLKKRIFKAFLDASLTGFDRETSFSNSE